MDNVYDDQTFMQKISVTICSLNRSHIEIAIEIETLSRHLSEKWGVQFILVYPRPKGGGDMYPCPCLRGMPMVVSRGQGYSW